MNMHTFRLKFFLSIYLDEHGISMLWWTLLILHFSVANAVNYSMFLDMIIIYSFEKLNTQKMSLLQLH